MTPSITGNGLLPSLLDNPHHTLPHAQQQAVNTLLRLLNGRRQAPSFSPSLLRSAQRFAGMLTQANAHAYQPENIVQGLTSDIFTGLMAPLVENALSNLLGGKKTRRFSRESDRSLATQQQWDDMRLSKGQQAVLLAQMIRRAQRNL